MCVCVCVSECQCVCVSVCVSVMLMPPHPLTPKSPYHPKGGLIGIYIYIHAKQAFLSLKNNQKKSGFLASKTSLFGPQNSSKTASK